MSLVTQEPTNQQRLQQSVRAWVHYDNLANTFNKQTQNAALEAVSRYCRSEGVSEIHRKKICDILEAELHLRRNEDTIYIHPSPQDTRLFFGEHFTFSPKKMSEIVKSGFRAAIDTLKRYEFADHLPRHAIGTTD